MNKILIVEDEEHVASFIVRGLRTQQFVTAIADDGEKALQAIEADVYDVILLDLGLPIKDGWAVLKELRKQGNAIPVIVITASPVRRQEVLAAGANDYISKPFRFKNLLTAIRRQVNADSG